VETVKANKGNLMFAFCLSAAELPNRLNGPECLTPERFAPGAAVLYLISG
jgi:hypothetical protein